MKHEYWIDSELNALISVVPFSGYVFEQDSAGNQIGVRAFQKGKPKNLSGTVVGYVIKPDGTMINRISGNRSGNKAWITLPADACALPGLIQVTIKMEENGAITTLGVIDIKVQNSM